MKFKLKALKNNAVSFAKTKNNTKETSSKKLIFMWALILFGYFLFIIQWYSIGNFSGGYANNIGLIKNDALNAMPNWTITLMRGVGSVIAGWLLVKIGHKYAVVTVLSLMVLSFPFIIFSSIKGIGNQVSDGTGGNYYPINFSMFLIFRMFLAIGGTTLIPYTNSIIGKMNANSRPKFMSINQFGFNGGALFANIFFCFGIAKVINSSDAWIYILSSFIVLIAIVLILYLIFADEVILPIKKQNDISFKNNEITFKKVIQEKYTWILSAILMVWLVVVVFINSPSMRTIIEQSPANFKTLVEWNWINKESDAIKQYGWLTSIAKSSLSTNKTVVVGSGYEWVWPAYVCVFVASFFAGMFVIAPFAKTIYKRKLFITIVFIIGYLFSFASLLVGYLYGYSNQIALAFFFILIFIGGFFLWPIQSVILSLYQQCEQSSPKYAGVIAGLVWGLGYVGYTIIEILLSVSLSYAGKFDFENNVSNILNELSNNNPMINVNDIWNQNFENGDIKVNEALGPIICFVGFIVSCLTVFIFIWLLPEAGIKDKNGNFVKFSLEWKIWNWNFKNKDVMIQ